jgi:protein-tyrosine-phosphatase
MNTKALNALAGVICRAQEQDRTPMGIAFAVDSAGLHMSPETAAELEQLGNDLDGARLARWEEEQDNARLRLALKSAKRRALRRLPHEREGLIFRLEQDNKQLHAFVEIANEAARVQCEAWEGAQDELELLRARVAELEAQRKADHETWQHDLRAARGEREAMAARIAELESERHSTNEALSDAAERMRADRDRIAELDQQLADAPIPVTLTAKAAESADKLTALIAPNACPSNVIDGDQGGHFFKKGAFKDSPIACRYCGMKRPEFGGVS